jgi:uncharacterized protein
MAEREERIAVEVVPSIGRLDAAEWDACAGDEDPFVSYAFLSALEDSGSAVAETGWLPQHLAIEEDGRLVGVAPLYLKGHSYGEYVFDWAWAGAYERAGMRYYPKLQSCVPFTPVTGRRLLLHPEADPARIEPALLGAMVELTHRLELSSVHVTFCTEAERDRGRELGLSVRSGVQYHWHNRGYTDYDDFLAALLGRKRKNLRKERREAAASGVRVRTLIGDDIKPADWDAFYEFYVSTIDRKWGSPYLTREFFSLLGERLGDAVVLMLGDTAGERICGALNLRGKRALYGRYWGAKRQLPSLHFEVCYHRAIELAIELGLARVEAGAQGQHKIPRGYLPVVTHSLHHLAHPRFREAIADFLAREREAVAEELMLLAEESPYAADRRFSANRPSDTGRPRADRLGRLRNARRND